MTSPFRRDEGVPVSCPGCGGLFDAMHGATHPYMISSASCWHHYGQLLAREYADPELLQTHRMSVDSYAAQHPGTHNRRAVQSVGLHLARIMLQLERLLSPVEANAMMLRLGKKKHTLLQLNPPTSFDFTVADITLDLSADQHRESVVAWATATWSAWVEHHDYVREWVQYALR